MRKFVIYVILFATNIPRVNANDLLNSQWVGLSIGRTNEAFKNNAGNPRGIGLTYSASVSFSTNRRFFISLEHSHAEEYQPPRDEFNKPIEYFNLESVSLGKYFIIKSLFIAPSLGFGWLKGINRGRWLGEPGKESYSCESLPYSSYGIYWKIESNTNAKGWLGIGIQFSGIFNSSKDFFRASLLFKIGNQHKE